MNIIAINGSPHRNGNTAGVLRVMEEELDKQEITVETVHVGHLPLRGCMGCCHCFTSENHRCVIGDDIVNDTAQKMRGADGFILASPTYYAGITGSMKCFLDRVFFTSSASFAYKVATTVTVERRAGGVATVQQLNNYLTLAEVILPPAQYWTVVFGNTAGEISGDFEGLQTVRKNARAMGWLLRVVAAGKEKVPFVEHEAHKFTNFIR